MGDQAQPMTVIQPRHVAHESWWTTAPRERFTETAATRTFRDVDAMTRARKHRIADDRVLPDEIG